VFTLERKGTEPAIVFVHGFLQSSVYWAPSLDRVAEHGIRGFAIDLPGFGASAGLGGPYTMAGLADALALQLDSWGVRQVALAGGDLIGARHWADDAVSTTTGWWHMLALTTGARVALAQGEPEQAERDLHDALVCGADIGARTGVADILECLADLSCDGGSAREATRLFGAAHAIRQRIGEVRFKIYDADYEATVEAVRNALGDEDFQSAWAEGAALSTEEAIAYAQRGRGERKRTSGWGSLTPTERDVVRLVSEGLAKKDIATQLFVSPRTVQTHLTHVYTKLGLTSRVQLVQEAACHT